MGDEGAPSCWPKHPLGDLLSRPLAYGVLKPGDYVANGVPLVRIQDVHTGRLDPQQMHRISRELHQEFKRTALEGGELLLSIVGTLGKVIEVPQALRDGNISRALCVIGLRPDVDTRFVRYVLTSLRVQSWITKEARGNAQAVLNLGLVRELLIQVPPLAEQRKIAAILSAVDEAIDATQAVIDQLQVLKKVMMAELLTRGLPGRHARFKQTEIGNVPETWSLAPVSKLGEVKLGRMRSPVYATGRNRPYLRVANVLDGEIDTSDVLEMPFEDDQFEAFRLRVGDILLNEGQSLELVGRAAMYRGAPPDCAFQKTLLRFRPGPQLDGCFALSVFQWWLYSGRFAENAVQTTSIAHLTGVRFAAMQMPVPLLAEQLEIASTLVSIDVRIASEGEFLQQLNTTKAALASMLLTGEVRVSLNEVEA